jgi:O-acetyl-ADP-ribose deacetylase
VTNKKLIIITSRRYHILLISYINRINITKGDITKENVDAIVNAANSSLLGGGGVDGAIHAAGGSQILEECMAIVRKIGELKTGEAVITSGGKLKAKYVIHTVGPIWHGGHSNEEVLLSNAYRNSLKLASEKGIKTIAFPNISTGVYGFPKELAAKIAFDTVKVSLLDYEKIEEVKFVCFDDYSYKLYLDLEKRISVVI